MSKTLARLARDAIAVQDACNMSGVARSFAEAVIDLREIMPTIGTSDFNMHPIICVWASKIHDMARMGISDGDRYGKAYKWCLEHQEVPSE
jgi:hypothetical protein